MGEQFWFFDLEVYEVGCFVNMGFQYCGFEYWCDGEMECFFYGIGVCELISLDLMMGELDGCFGVEGCVDMMKGFG